jgi:hypothetical protein
VATPQTLGLEQIRRVGEQCGGRPHQLGLVVGHGAAGGRVAQREHVEVLGEDAGRGHPVPSLVLLAELREHPRPDAALGGP